MGQRPTTTIRPRCCWKTSAAATDWTSVVSNIDRYQLEGTGKALLLTRFANAIRTGDLLSVVDSRGRWLHTRKMLRVIQLRKLTNSIGGASCRQRADSHRYISKP